MQPLPQPRASHVRSTDEPQRAAARDHPPPDSRGLARGRASVSRSCAQPGAEFWTRWAAVRYLNDEFLDRFEWERAFVGELHAFLPVEATERLQRQGDRLARLRLDLDRVGRRRGTGVEVATTTREFLEQLALWCTEIEAAARAIPREALTEHGVTLLEHLETAELMRP